MAVIRSRQAAALVREAVVLDLGDLARQGEAIRQRAVAQADQILREARDEARRIAQSAAEKGHAEGFKTGLAEGQRQGAETGRNEAFARHAAAIEALLKQWTEALGAFIESRKTLLTEARLDVLRLALAIAERVVFRTVEIDPGIIEDQMAEALSLLARRSALTIRLHPRDLELAQAVLPRLAEQMHQCEHAALAPDESITPGGCVVQAGSTTIDSTIETQLDRIVATLLPDDPALGAPADDRAQGGADREAQP